MVPHLSGGKYIMFKMEMQMRPFWKEMVRFSREQCDVAPYFFEFPSSKTTAPSSKNAAFPEVSYSRSVSVFGGCISLNNKWGPLEYFKLVMWMSGPPKFELVNGLLTGMVDLRQTKGDGFLCIHSCIKFYQVTLASLG